MYGRGHGGGGGGGIGIGPPVTPSVIKYLIIANLGVFMLQLAMPGFTQAFAIQPANVWLNGFLWQPFSYMWLHSQHGLFHIIMNMFVLWMFGSQLALVWGAKRFFRYYMICGIGAGFIIATWPFIAVWTGLAEPWALAASTLGASGAIYGVMLAYSLTWPDRTIMLIFPPVAFRAIWLIPILFFLSMLMDPSGRVSHVGHLGGVIAGWIYMRRRGQGGPLFSWRQLQHRWRRYRMRQKLRAVRAEEFQERRRRNQDRTLH